MLTAYYCAFDRRTPTHVRVALIGALVYFISPLDLLPDVLPIVGFTDDAAVLAGAIKLVWDQIKPEHRDAAREALARMNKASETLDAEVTASTPPCPSPCARRCPSAPAPPPPADRRHGHAR